MLLPLFALALADDTFFADSGPELRSMAALTKGGVVVGRTGELLARLDDPAALDGDRRIAEVQRRRGGVVRIVPAAGVDDLGLARSLHGRPGVVWVHPNLRLAVHLDSVPNDPLYADEWHLDETEQGGIDINAPEAWEYATGKGVTIAVLDSGVQLDHPDLVVTAGHDYVGDDEDPSPGSDGSAPHGTGVAGIAAARGNNGYGVAGVAWEADLYAIRLIDATSTVADIYDGFTEAVDAGAGVLSNSWGFYGCDGVPDMSEFKDMFDYAEHEGRGGLGAVVVFAAGNDNCDNSRDAMLDYKTPIVVAALERNDQRSWYSNYGDDLDIAAPTSILTTDMSPGGYGSYGGDDAFADGFSGTSGATPVVSGVVALMLEANPRLTAKQVREAICATAVRNDLATADYDDSGWSPYYGCGRIDAGAAVATVFDTAPSAPVPVPASSAYVERVVPSWAPAEDPDHDLVNYGFVWWLDGADPALEDTHYTANTHYTLTGKVAVGDVVHWQIHANDVWGAGPVSEVQTVTVGATPEPPVDTGEAPDPTPSTCASVGALPSVLGLGLVAAAAAVVTRRRPGVRTEG